MKENNRIICIKSRVFDRNSSSVIVVVAKSPAPILLG